MRSRKRPFPFVSLDLCHVCCAARRGRVYLAGPIDLLLGAGRQSTRARARVRPERQPVTSHRATLSCVPGLLKRVTAGNPIAVGLFQAAIGAIGGVLLWRCADRLAGDVRVDVLRGGNLLGLCWFRAGSDGRADFVGFWCLMPSGVGPGPSDYKLHRKSTAPTVKPAPTDASRTRSPFFSRPARRASPSASGMVAAVVLPYVSRLMITLSVRARAARPRLR